MFAHAHQRVAETRPPSAFRDDDRAETLVRLLGLEPRGPYRLPLDEPLNVAWQLAAKLTLEAILRLRDVLELPHGWPASSRSEVDEERLWAALRVGLPLTSVCAPEAFREAGDGVLRVRAAEQQGFPERTRLEAVLPTFISVENAFWNLAGSEIPYAIRFALIEWFRPRTEESPLPGICLRCGVVQPRWTWTAYKQEPRCASCRRRRREDGDPPDHAIAYAARGTYWLRCQADSCTLAFEGRRHAKHCPGHTTSKLTASRRPRSIPVP